MQWFHTNGLNNGTDNDANGIRVETYGLADVIYRITNRTDGMADDKSGITDVNGGIISYNHRASDECYGIRDE